jgi:hypothetical protein
MAAGVTTCSPFCGSCNTTLNAIIRRWLDGDRDETNEEFAVSLGLTTTALEQRISRMKRGKR